MNYQFFLYIALASILSNIVYGIMIVNYLSERGTKINYFLIRLLMIKYIQQYKMMTQEECGKPGLAYYGWIVTINLTLVFAITGIIFKVS